MKKLPVPAVAFFCCLLISVQAVDIATLSQKAGEAERKDDYIAAIGYWNDAIALTPGKAGTPELFLKRGNSYFVKGDAAKALEDYNRAITLDPKYAAAYSARARTEGFAGETAKAMDDYAAALKIEPSNSSVYFDRAGTYARLGEIDKAIADYDHAIQLSPKNSYAYIYRGAAWRKKGDNDKAIADFTEALRITPGLSEAYTNRSAAWFGKGNYDKVIQDCNEALMINARDSQALNNRAAAYLNKGDYERAIEDSESALILSPGNLLAYSNRASAYAHIFDYPHVLESLEKAVTIAPDDPALMNNLAWFLATCPDDSLRNGAKAVQLATKACELTNWKMWICIDTLGAAQAETGRYEDAAKSAQMALDVMTVAKASPANLQPVQSRLALYQQGKPFREEGKKTEEKEGFSRY